MTSEHPKPDRPTLVADTAIALIAERGLRGLTHRAVDEAAGLPTGSTSNLARTRAALLELAITRIAELEAPTAAEGPTELPTGQPGDLLTELITGALHQALTTGRTLTIARFELALEATRRPELRAVYDRLGAGFLDLAAALLAGCGSAAPEADAWRVLRWCDGLLFNSTVGSGSTHPLGKQEVHEEVTGYLRALLA